MNDGRAGSQYTEVNRKPLEAVHQKDCDLVALADPALQKKICHTVRLFVKDAPGHFPPVLSGRIILN